MTKKIQRILIAVKPWESKLPISTSHVCYLAQGLKAEVALTSCVRLSALTESLAWTYAEAGTDPVEPILNQENDEHAQLELLAQPLRDAGVTITTRVRSDPRAAHGILEEVSEWQADLLIAGVHEPESALRPRLLDVDWQLMRLCPCPLLLVRASQAAPYRTILAAVDPLHGHAEPLGLDHAILSTARHLRDTFEAELRIVNVYPNPNNYEVASSIEVEPGILYGTENIEAVYRQAVINLLNECDVADSQVTLRSGKPAEIIGELVNTEAINLIVLGSIKRGSIEAMLLGSTAERVVREAPCDVLLVKPPAQ